MSFASVLLLSDPSGAATKRPGILDVFPGMPAGGTAGEWFRGITKFSEPYSRLQLKNNEQAAQLSEQHCPSEGGWSGRLPSSTVQGEAGKKRTADKRNEALAIYVSSRGVESLSSIAKTLGIARNTLSKWRQDDNWDAKLAETEQQATAKAIEVMSDQLANEISKHFKIDSEHLDVLDKILFWHLIAKDKRGLPLRNEQGMLMPATKFDSAAIMSLYRLAACRNQISTTRRMILGLPTGQVKVDQSVTGKIENETTIYDRLGGRRLEGLGQVEKRCGKYSHGPYSAAPKQIASGPCKLLFC